MVQWEATDLHVQPPSIEMGSHERRVLTFAASGASTAVTARLTNLATLLEEPAPIEAATLANSTTAAVTLAGLTPRTTYQLSVTFTNASALREECLLVVECVA